LLYLYESVFWFPSYLEPLQSRIQTTSECIFREKLKAWAAFEKSLLRYANASLAQSAEQTIAEARAYGFEGAAIVETL